MAINGWDNTIVFCWSNRIDSKAILIGISTKPIDFVIPLSGMNRLCTGRECDTGRRSATLSFLGGLLLNVALLSRNERGFEDPLSPGLHAVAVDKLSRSGGEVPLALGPQRVIGEELLRCFFVEVREKDDPEGQDDVGSE